ncbi:hypothetical protein D3C72_1965220 [compost metagenome]
MVRAVSTLPLLCISQRNRPRAPVIISTDTISTRQTKNPDSRVSPGGRGRRPMMPCSAGSKASASPRVLEVTMLIHSTCAGVSGRVSSKRIAAITTSASPPLVGSMKSTNFFRLS